MQLTYDQAVQARRKDQLTPEETRNIPFFGFVMGTLVSMALWGAIAWTVWAVLN